MNTHIYIYICIYVYINLYIYRAMYEQLVTRRDICQTIFFCTAY